MIVERIYKKGNQLTGYLAILSSNRIGVSSISPLDKGNISKKFGIHLAVGRALDITPELEYRREGDSSCLIINRNTCASKMKKIKKRLDAFPFEKGKEISYPKFLIEKITHYGKPFGYICAFDKNRFGISLCNTSDKWNPTLGRQLAIGRAYFDGQSDLGEILHLQENPAQFYNSDYFASINDAYKSMVERAERYFKNPVEV